MNATRQSMLMVLIVLMITWLQLHGQKGEDVV